MDYSMTRLPLSDETRLPRGSIVALITPFAKDGGLDRTALRKLIDFHVTSGTAAIAVVGTTGESSTLSHVEHREVIAAAVEYAEGRIHIMAGVGANSTSEAVELARFASDHGASSLLSVVPYYVKPTQQGLFDHFTAQADVVRIPLVLYNVPGRTVTDMTASTVARLAHHPNIRGLKDATGDMARAVEILRALPSGFALYSGDDFTSLPYLALGGWGVISVLANVVPAKVVEMCSLMEQGKIARARRLFVQLQPLTRALFAETSPGPVKYAASLLGQCEATLRLPLVIPGEPTRRLIEQCVKGELEHAA
ncbi:4-hydroxy-tetrahydrodipicolinate synthase [Trinickia mobilis]|uniref:4-hydroxy-tetrahydrodipicolinate synthase n=1 Tax=Trinickia mobilis TaxID=2816356 RepID=UPI001F5C2489|nr:4-hydroxy-tetrahydrodipicolinate synthase [Trinickia mobilis]